MKVPFALSLPSAHGAADPSPKFLDLTASMHQSDNLGRTPATLPPEMIIYDWLPFRKR